MVERRSFDPLSGTPNPKIVEVEIEGLPTVALLRLPCLDHRHVGQRKPAAETKIVTMLL
jgi:hypothetical protein